MSRYSSSIFTLYIFLFANHVPPIYIGQQVRSARQPPRRAFARSTAAKGRQRTRAREWKGRAKADGREWDCPRRQGIQGPFIDVFRRDRSIRGEHHRQTPSKEGENPLRR